MDEQQPQTQTQTVSVSKTKMAIAVGFLGLAALAAGFTGMRARGTVKADLVFAKSGVSVEDGMNKLSFTLLNKGSLAVTSPFVLNVKLGDGKNVVHTVKVQNPPSADIKGSLENLDSKDGSFDILAKNFKLKPGQSTTVTYWFIIPSEYDATSLPFEYTWDTTNLVSETNELNSHKGSYNIEQMGLVKEVPILIDTPLETQTETTDAASTPVSDTVTSTPTATTVEPMPDLVIQNFNISDSPYAGRKNVSITIKNIGNAPALRPSTMHQNFGTFVVQLYFMHDDGSVYAFPQYLSSNIYYATMNLAAGKEMTISKDVQMADTYLTNFDQIKMKVDWVEGSVTSIAPFTEPGRGYILESNEDNNEKTKKFR